MPVARLVQRLDASPLPRGRLSLGRSSRVCRFRVPDGASVDRPAPVLVVVSGGAWIIGYRMWAFLFGFQLARRGIVCVSVDYRNFPQARIPQMVDDVEEADIIAMGLEEVGGSFGNRAPKLGCGPEVCR